VNYSFQKGPGEDANLPNDDSALLVPAQWIPVPKSISPEGQAFLANAAARIAMMQQAGVAAPSTEEMAAAAVQFLGPLASRFEGSEEVIALAHGAKLYRMAPAGRKGRRAEVAHFDIHGGGFVAGGGEMCRLLARIRAKEYGVEVFAVDYRLAPLHQYPAALDDCMAAYREVLARIESSALAVAGASAGGNLAAALMLRAHDEGLPMPAALLLQTPAVDIADVGDTRHTNRYLDLNLYGGNGEGPNGYAGSADPTDPYLSPIYGAFPKEWPRTMLTSGTRDLLLSDTVRMHRALRRAGIEAELHVSEASPHGGFMGANAPEDAEIMAECRRFLYTAWNIAN
jgi:acetyl esterase/lipase